MNAPTPTRSPAAEETSADTYAVRTAAPRAKPSDSFW